MSDTEIRFYSQKITMMKTYCVFIFFRLRLGLRTGRVGVVVPVRWL